MTMEQQLRERAIETIRNNDQGSYTIPSAGLYPFQWNWDSCLVALGFARFDRKRAWQEIETLFKGQWANGMVPSIIFWADVDDYFPGKDVWDSRTDPATAGHSQPPVAASVVWSMLQEGIVDDKERAAVLFPKLLSYHDWYHKCRDPDGTGLVAITHPWESGRDNSPDWDDAMANIKVDEDLGDYQRKDLQHVDSDARPTKEHYDRYLTLVNFGRKCRWDPMEIYANNQFLVVDPGVQFILLRADRDLLAIAEFLGEQDAVAQIKEWIALAEQGSEGLWDGDLGGYCAKDLRTGRMSPGLSHASMLAWYAGLAGSERKEQMAKAAWGMLEGVKYGMPSWKAGTEGFEPKRYFRGPVWAIMNHMIAKGMREQGENELADRIKSDAMSLIAEHGFKEYYDPVTGEGSGGDSFSWTAAMALAWQDGKD